MLGINNDRKYMRNVEIVKYFGFVALINKKHNHKNLESADLFKLNSAE